MSTRLQYLHKQLAKDGFGIEMFKLKNRWKYYLVFPSLENWIAMAPTERQAYCTFRGIAKRHLEAQRTLNEYFK